MKLPELIKKAPKPQRVVISWLEKIRKKEDMTIPQFEKYLGVAPTYYRHYYTGRRLVGFLNAIKWAKRFNWNLNKLK